MDARDKALLEWRAAWSLGLEAADHPVLHFQQTVLRPLLKLQNNLLCAHLWQYLSKHPQQAAKEPEGRVSLLQHFFQKDPMFGQALRHLVIGCMTLSEYQFYLQHQSDLNKRLNSMLQQRLLDQWPDEKLDHFTQG